MRVTDLIGKKVVGLTRTRVTDDDGNTVYTLDAIKLDNGSVVVLGRDKNGSWSNEVVPFVIESGQKSELKYGEGEE